MSFKFGDVVMFAGRPHFVVACDDDINLMTLTDGVSTTSEIDYQDVVKIGHDASLEQEILDRLERVVKKHNQVLMGNQEQLIGRLKDVCFEDNDADCFITGNTKKDGNYLYCQIESGSDYEWVLVEELLDRLFK